MASAEAFTTYPRGFNLEDTTGTVVAQGYEVFGMYIVSWLGEPPNYRTWPSIDAAIEAHGSQDAGLTVVWL